jgi:hypothetical protein
VNEANCARLIKMGMGLGDLGGAVLVDEGYTDEEIAVANETVQRAKGGRFSVQRGTITIEQSGPHHAAFTSTCNRIARIARLA